MNYSAPDFARTVVRSLGPGETLRVGRGDRTLLLERSGGQCRLHRLKGGEPEEEMLLGTGKGMTVLVEVFLPPRPVILELANRVALGPGGTLKGYVRLPLFWKIWLRGQQGPARLLDELPPPGLRLTFLAAGRQEYAHPVQTRLLPRRPYLQESLDEAVMPLHLVSREDDWTDVQRLYLPLAGVALHRLGGTFFADPARYVLELGRARLQVRGLGGRAHPFGGSAS